MQYNKNNCITFAYIINNKNVKLKPKTMSKKTTKKSAKNAANKPAAKKTNTKTDEKKLNKKETSSTNEKKSKKIEKTTPIATPAKKRVRPKKNTEAPKVEKNVTAKATKKQSVKKVTTKISPKKETPKKVAAQKAPKQKDYTGKIFTIEAETLGFIKLPDGNFGVRLNKGVSVTKTDTMSYQIIGYNENGEKFGTVFDCIDQTEADKFLEELLAYVKDGSVSMQKAPKSNVKKVDLDNIQEALVASEATTEEKPTQNEGLQMPNESDKIRSYANTILEAVKNSMSVRINGAMPKAQFDGILKSCSSEYSYELKNDGNGYYLIVSQEGNSVKTPEGNEFLPIN